MAITFLPESNVFHLSTNQTSYVIKIYKKAYPMHLYWGPSVRNADLGWSLEAPYRRKGIIERAEPGTDTFTLEFWPLEYPAYGTSDFRPPAYQIEDKSGNRVSDATYTGYEIVDGKPPLDGLPSCYAQSVKEAQTLKLFLLDPVLKLKITLLYTVFPGYDVIARHTEFENLGDEALTLHSALSLSLDMKHKPDELIQLSGTALREKHIIRRPLQNGSTGFESTRGISSHQETPFMVLADAHTSEQSGEAYGFSLLYSGNFTATVSCDMYDSARVQLGINPFLFDWKLNPSASFCTPECVQTYSAQGLNLLSQNFHSLFRERLSRGKFRDAERPVLLNTWEASYFTFDHESVMQLAKEAQPLGVEMLVLDDGWFGRRNTSSCSLGDWKVNPRKLPRGLTGLCDDINGLGMKLGLWFEPEMVSPDSDLYRKHPEWCIHVPERVRTLWRSQLVLDLTREDVRNFIIESVSDVLFNSNIEYVKWDNNRRITEIGSDLLPKEQKGEFSHRYVLGLYQVLEALTSRFPNVLFENCASGGARFDPGMMHYFSQTWPSDNTDGADRLKIQYGNSLAYPPVWITAHVSASPNHQTGRSLPLEFREHSSTPFNLGYELDLCKMDAVEKNAVRKQIVQYKSIRKLVQFGNFYRLKSPFEGDETAWMTVSKDKSRFLVWYYKTIGNPEEAYLNLKLAGLDPQKDYRCLNDNKIYGGDALMNLGLTIPWQNGDYLSVLWKFIRVK